MAAVDVLSQQMAMKATLDYICEPRLGALISRSRAAPGRETGLAPLTFSACCPLMQTIGPWVASLDR